MLIWHCYTSMFEHAHSFKNISLRRLSPKLPPQKLPSPASYHRVHFLQAANFVNINFAHHEPNTFAMAIFVGACQAPDAAGKSACVWVNTNAELDHVDLRWDLKRRHGGREICNRFYSEGVSCLQKQLGSKTWQVACVWDRVWKHSRSICHVKSLDWWHRSSQAHSPQNNSSMLLLPKKKRTILCQVTGKRRCSVDFGVPQTNNYCTTTNFAIFCD